MRVIDFLIIGQGITGTFLSYYLDQAAYSYVVIDENKLNTSSKISAGLINPVTGRRQVKSWLIDELMPFGWNAYKEIGNFLNIRCIKETSLLRFFPSPDMLESFRKKLSEKSDYLSEPEGKNWDQYFQYPFGIGEVKPCYITDLPKLIFAWQEYLIHNKKLIQEKFDNELLKISDNRVHYKDINAEKIIFCDGIIGIYNRFFDSLPYSSNKGEALILEIENLPSNYIYKFKNTLVPLQENLFWFGSNNEWEFTDDQPTETFRKNAEMELNYFLKLPYKIVDHKAAIRAANIERRPFVGFHPVFPQIGILNGMGTKGCSLAPYFANQLTQHFINEVPLLPEIDIKRFTNLLSRHET